MNYLVNLLLTLLALASGHLPAALEQLCEI